VLTSTDEFVDVQRPSALEHLGDSYCDEDPDRAEEFYRRLLAEYPTLNATTHTVEIALAELLIKMRRYDEALELLNSFLERKTAQFPNILFRWHLALIDIASAMREKETVQRAREWRWSWPTEVPSSHDTRTLALCTPTRPSSAGSKGSRSNRSHKRSSSFSISDVTVDLASLRWTWASKIRPRPNASEGASWTCAGHFWPDDPGFRRLFRSVRHRRWQRRCRRFGGI
jgi:tetratricopeptide (TPR) repeat protein